MYFRDTKDGAPLTSTAVCSENKTKQENPTNKQKLPPTKRNVSYFYLFSNELAYMDDRSQAIYNSQMLSSS